MPKKIKVDDFEKGAELLHHESKPFTGIAEIFNDKGRKVTEGVYLNGKRNGLFTYWNSENGKKVAEENFENHKLHGLLTEYHANGAKEVEKNYKNGELHGLWVVFKNDGSEEYRRKYENGETVGGRQYPLDPEFKTTKVLLFIFCIIMPLIAFFNQGNTEAVGDMFMLGIAAIVVVWIFALIGRKI